MRYLSTSPETVGLILPENIKSVMMSGAGYDSSWESDPLMDWSNLGFQVIHFPLSPGSAQDFGVGK